MKSRESEVATQIRLKQWAEDIRDCMKRPANMTVDEWCKQHGIKKANYYWRLKRVRQACLDTLEESQATFTELPAPQECNIPIACVQKNTDRSFHPSVMAVLRMGNGTSIEITECASEEFVRLLIGVAAHAE